MKKYKLPKPDGKYGHTPEQIDRICKDLGIDRLKFSEAFGVNTAAVDGDTGKINYYTCDIERALWVLGKGGKYHEWD